MKRLEPNRAAPPDFDAAPRLSEQTKRALATLPGLEAMQRYYQLDDALEEAIEVLQKATHRNAAAQAVREVGLCPADLTWLGDEAVALCEYAAMGVRKSGRSALERVMTRRSTPGPETDVGKILRAMLDAKYHVGWIEQVKRGVGIVLFDVFRLECVPIVCPELAGRDSKGAAIATRVIEVEGLSMITGAPLYLFNELVEEARAMLSLGTNAQGHSIQQGVNLTPELEANIERTLLTAHYDRLLS